MKQFAEISRELEDLLSRWETKLLELSDDVIMDRKNKQSRNIKQILGHMCDSASNNIHRVVHLQYQQSPFAFPNYATHGNNDRWIAIQNYGNENWETLVNLWKYLNLHFAHIIQQIETSKLQHKWIASPGQEVSLEEMVPDYNRHFKLHLEEIDELIRNRVSG
jgi:hypothetical protein